MISAAELKHRIPDAATVARDLYELEFNRGVARCPFGTNHTHGDRDPSLRHDKKKDRIFCASQNCLGEKGVDAIGLVQRMDRCTFPEVIKKLASHYSIPTGGDRPGLRRGDSATRSEDRTVSSDQKKRITAEVVRRSLARDGYRPVAEFPYGDFVRRVRFEHESLRQEDKNRAAKEFRWEHFVDGIWYSGDGGLPKPLYVNRVFRQREHATLAVGFEGEAKADLAGELGIPGFSFKDITPDQAAALTDWDVALWPDNDESGKRQADHAAQVIHDAAHR